MRKLIAVVGIGVAVAAAVLLARKAPIEPPEGPDGTWDPAPSVT